jgi:sarcosine oxidase, subunit beta
MGSSTADVIVIGGGIAGSSIAFRLAGKGHSVILLEKGRVGEEASGRCGGGVRQQGRDPAELPLAMEAIKLWADMKDELDCDVGYRRGGNIRFAHTREKLESLREVAERETRIGLAVDILSPEDTRRLTPTLSEKVELFGSKYCPTDGTANPLLVVKAICRAARRQGVQIHEHSPVREFKARNGRVAAAVTEKGVYEGAVFVNAAGPYTKGLCNTIGLDIPITIEKETIMVTEVLPPMVKQFVESDKFYYRQALEGNLHIAGSLTTREIEHIDTRVDFESFVEVGRWLPTFVPVTRNIKLIRAFTGILEFTPDKIPVLDRAPGFENFFVTTGFSGHGFCLGPVVGKLMAEWIADGKSSLDLSQFGWSRLETVKADEKIH